MVNASAPIAVRIAGKTNDKVEKKNSVSDLCSSKNMADPIIWKNCQRKMGNKRKGKKVNIPRIIF